MDKRKKRKKVEYLKRKHLPESELKKKLEKQAPEEAEESPAPEE